MLEAALARNGAWARRLRDRYDLDWGEWEASLVTCKRRIGACFGALFSESKTERMVLELATESGTVLEKQIRKRLEIRRSEMPLEEDQIFPHRALKMTVASIPLFSLTREFIGCFVYLFREPPPRARLVDARELSVHLSYELTLRWKQHTWETPRIAGEAPAEFRFNGDIKQWPLINNNLIVHCGLNHASDKLSRQGMQTFLAPTRTGKPRRQQHYLWAPNQREILRHVYQRELQTVRLGGKRA